MHAANIKDFEKGSGAEIATGYSRGDKWKPTSGTHVECSGKVSVIGAGIGASVTGEAKDGVLVRCGGCLMSWVLL
jgi:hypothetical protein